MQEKPCSLTPGINVPAFQKKNVILTVKYGSGSVMVWGCPANSKPVSLAVIDGTTNSALNQKIVWENVWPSLCAL